jgi:hypothetical protein
VRRDALAIGKQDAGVREHHDAVAEQAPSLFGIATELPVCFPADAAPDPAEPAAVMMRLGKADLISH